VLRAGPREQTVPDTRAVTSKGLALKQELPGPDGRSARNDCRLKKSLRKEVVFAVCSCTRTRKDGGDRLGVARPEAAIEAVGKRCVQVRRPRHEVVGP
jgi:hypothetical protein